MSHVDALITELEQEAHSTRRVLERIPEDKLDWKPHEKSMTFGELAMHVAAIPGAVTELSTKPSSDVNTPVPRPSAANVSEILATLDDSLERARTLLSSMDDAALESPWKMMNGDQEILVMPRSVFLRSILLNQWYHHRGQLTVYLRLTNTPVPGIYGASADEAPAIE